MEFKDYYSVLGVEPGAGEAELKTAYRRLARKYHPDVSKETGAEERFKSVNEAYEVLRDPEKRAAYDQLRARGYRPGQDFRPPPDFGAGGQPGFEFEFGESGGFSDFFESLFGRARGGHPGGPARGPAGDSRAHLQIPLELAYAGGQQRIRLDGRQLDINIPAGIRPGQVIRLAGQGSGGGNLLLELGYKAHPDFEVDGHNVLYLLPVAPWEAALGAEIAVPTLGGPVTVKIPANSDSGRKLRLRGRGLPGKSPGDQIVELEVRTPPARSEEHKELYRRMARDFEQFDPRRG